MKKRELPYVKPGSGKVLLLKATELQFGHEVSPEEFARIQENPSLRATTKRFLSTSKPELLVEALLESELAGEV